MDDLFQPDCHGVPCIEIELQQTVGEGVSMLLHIAFDGSE